VDYTRSGHTVSRHRKLQSDQEYNVDPSTKGS
jgi:hypothetical protein